MTIGKTPPFETKRLILRYFVENDVDAVHAYASDPDNTRFMLFGPNTVKDTREYIQYAMEEAAKHPQGTYEFAVILKETGQLIGACGISSPGLSSQDNFADGTAEIGWVMNRAYWQRGYGAEMGRFLLTFGFTELKCHRIIARCDAENMASYRLMEKIGMRREGLLIEGRRSNRTLGHVRRDELAYAILADEWYTQQEMRYFSSLPVIFNGFVDLPPLTDGTLELVCVSREPADPERKYVPGYIFEMRLCATGEQVGEINLRIGYTDGLYYGGQIGYAVEEPYRGNGYAGRACKLLTPVMRTHGMTRVLITNNHSNDASRRVCEKLGAKLLRVARLPEWHDLYHAGQRFENIFVWDIDK